MKEETLKQDKVIRTHSFRTFVGTEKWIAYRDDTDIFGIGDTEYDAATDLLNKEYDAPRI